MSNTATKARPAAPKPGPRPETKPDVKPEATPKQVDNVPEMDAPVRTSKKGQNSAYAPTEVRAKLVERLEQMKADGWTRPAISAITGFSDSQVWRAQNLKAHTTELDQWVAFIKEVDEGKHQPPAPRRKAKPEELQAKINKALEALAQLGDKPNVTALRAAVTEVKDALTA